VKLGPQLRLLRIQHERPVPVGSLNLRKRVQPAVAVEIADTLRDGDQSMGVVYELWHRQRRAYSCEREPRGMSARRFTAQMSSVECSDETDIQRVKRHA
jgi:hypothetical protein